MERLKRELRAIRADRVLDVATRYGDFARILAENLGAYTEIIAIDVNAGALEKGRARLKDLDGVRFMERDGCDTGFPDGSFDVAALSNSLHHIPDTEALLKEMRRVLARDGRLILAEMTADGQHGAGKTHALVHEWESDIDTACGTYHRRTYTKAQILDMIRAAGFRIETAYLTDAFSKEAGKGLSERLTGDAMNRSLSRADGKDAFDALLARMQDIQAYYADNGVAFATMLVVIARP